MLRPITLALFVCATAHAEWRPTEGGALVGTAAPEWRGLNWIQGGPLTLAKLRGKPVLVRFWTDGCSLCQASAPSVRALDEQYRAHGLVVVGIHHPKSEESHDPRVVARAAKALGFAFPIATDPDWATVKAYGVGTIFQRYTSVSFLVDRAGVIRWVHDGGVLEADALASLRQAIEAQLK